MRFYEEQQFYMLQRVAAYLKKNKEKLTAKAPVLNELIHYFVERVEEMQRLSITRKNIVRVSAGEKKSVKDGLINALTVLADMLYGHYYKEDRKESPAAEDSNGTKLKRDFGYTAPELNRMSAATLCKVSEQVIGASKKIKRLQIYGLTEGDIKEAEEYYKEFAIWKDKPTQSRKEVKGRNERISLGIKECISMLDNRMDRFVRLATRDDKTLRRYYEGSRVIMGDMFGRPSDRERRFRQSRKKKIDAHELIHRYVRFLRKHKRQVSEAILYGTYAKRQAYSNSKIEVALVLSERDAGNITNSSLAPLLEKKFPAISPRYFSQKQFNGNDAFIKRIRETGVRVEI